MYRDHRKVLAREDAKEATGAKGGKDPEDEEDEEEDGPDAEKGEVLERGQASSGCKYLISRFLQDALLNSCKSYNS